MYGIRIDTIDHRIWRAVRVAFLDDDDDETNTIRELVPALAGWPTELVLECPNGRQKCCNVLKRYFIAAVGRKLAVAESQTRKIQEVHHCSSIC